MIIFGLVGAMLVEVPQVVEMGKHLRVDITIEPYSLPPSDDPRILGPSMNVIFRKTSNLAERDDDV